METSITKLFLIFFNSIILFKLDHQILLKILENQDLLTNYELSYNFLDFHQPKILMKNLHMIIYLQEHQHPLRYVG